MNESLESDFVSGLTVSQRQAYAKLRQQVALDAYKQGCTDSATECLKVWTETPGIHDQVYAFRLGYKQAANDCEQAITTLRDNKTI